MAAASTSSSSSPFAVVAIDFGTSRTGVAYGFISDDGSVPDVFKKVYPQDGYHKQPTCLYVDVATSKCLAFGHEAREMAALDLTSPDHCTDISNRHLFDSYKRGLEGDTLSGETKWSALDTDFVMDDFEILSTPAEFPVSKLISMTLNSVKKEVLDFVKSRDGISLVADQVRWVITVPAIWSEPAKLIMKKSAIEAGLIRESSPSSHLILALEPEAAVLGASRDLKTSLEDMVGKTVMVADNGGGTVDICAVIVESTNPFKCRHAVESTGGWWGSTTVDDELEKFLLNLLGTKLFNSFKAAAVPRLSMLSAWESYKKMFSSTTVLPFDCRLDFLDEQEFGNVNLRNMVGEFSNNTFGPIGDLAARAFVVKVPPSFVRSFFDVSTKKIVEHLRVQSDKVVEEGNPAVTSILLAGGFSESPYLQEMISGAFTEQVIISHNSGSLIQTGAVMYGLAPETITSRIMRYTFGCGVSRSLKNFSSDHQDLVPDDKYVFLHKEKQVDYVKNCFEQFVEKGETVNFSDEITRSLIPLYESSSNITIDIYYTAKTMVPCFVDEPLVKKIGTLVVNTGDYRKGKREVSIAFRFGLSSFEVAATAELTGEVFKTELNVPK